MSLRTRLFNIYWTMRRAVVPTLRYSQYCYEDSILPSWRANEERQLVK